MKYHYNEFYCYIECWYKEGWLYEKITELYIYLATHIKQSYEGYSILFI